MITGWPPGLLQDDCAGLSKWLADKPDARRLVREKCLEIDMLRKQEPNEVAQAALSLVLTITIVVFLAVMFGLGALVASLTTSALWPTALILSGVAIVWAVIHVAMHGGA